MIFSIIRGSEVKKVILASLGFRMEQTSDDNCPKKERGMKCLIGVVLEKC